MAFGEAGDVFDCPGGFVFDGCVGPFGHYDVGFDAEGAQELEGADAVDGTCCAGHTYYEAVVFEAGVAARGCGC